MRAPLATVVSERRRVAATDFVKDLLGAAVAPGAADGEPAWRRGVVSCLERIVDRFDEPDFRDLRKRLVDAAAAVGADGDVGRGSRHAGVATAVHAAIALVDSQVATYALQCADAHVRAAIAARDVPALRVARSAQVVAITALVEGAIHAPAALRGDVEALVDAVIDGPAYA